MFEFGLRPDDRMIARRGEQVRWWGARAIYHPEDKWTLDILPNRQGWSPAPDTSPLFKRFHRFIDEVFLKQLNKELRERHISADSRDHLVVTDGRFVGIASPRGSFGYVYIGAWEHMGCELDNRDPNDTGLSVHCVPEGCALDLRPTSTTPLRRDCYYELRTVEHQAEVTHTTEDGRLVPAHKYTVFKNETPFVDRIWVSPQPIPAIGTVVNINFNGIGLAEVRGYFTECGYMAVECAPHDPPEWFVGQNSFGCTVLAFGPEVEVVPIHPTEQQTI